MGNHYNTYKIEGPLLDVVACQFKKKDIVGGDIKPHLDILKVGDRIDNLVYMGGMIGGDLQIYERCVVEKLANISMIDDYKFRDIIRFSYEHQVPLVETERTLIKINRGDKLTEILK